MRLLIVEDNSALLKSLKKGLEEKAFAVDTAEDGERGLFLADVSDVVAAIILAAERPESRGRVFFVTDGLHPKNRRLVSRERAHSMTNAGCRKARAR